jgi:hypothetical protein
VLSLVDMVEKEVEGGLLGPVLTEEASIFMSETLIIVCKVSVS